MKLETRRIIILTALIAAFAVGALTLPEKREAVTHSPVQVRAPKYEPLEFYESAFAKAPKEPVSQKIGGLFVNHHLLAPDLVAQSLLSAANQLPKTVILVSPNHFSEGVGRFITSGYDWQTPYGKLEADRDLIKKLGRTSSLLEIDETPFENEHGIYNIMPFIKKAFPQTKVVPVMVKEFASEDEIKSFAAAVARHKREDVLLVGSFDFSHYLSTNGADFTDAKTLAALENFDYASMDRLDVDSKAGLKLMLMALEAQGYLTFKITAHTNSGKIARNANYAETTSYLNGYFIKGEKVKNEDISFLYFGNWTSAGASRFGDFRSPQYALGKLDRLIAGTDVAAASGDSPAAERGIVKAGYTFGLGHGSLLEALVRGRIVGFLSYNGGGMKPNRNNIVLTTSRKDAESAAKSAVAVYLMDGGLPRVEASGGVPVLSNFGTMSFSDGIAPAQDIVAGGVWNGSRVSVYLFPVEVQSGVVRLLADREAGKILAKVAENSPAELRDQIKTGIINFTKP